MTHKNSYISALVFAAGFWLLGIASSAASSETDTRLVNQRYQFQEAEKALRQGNLQQYRRLEQQLHDYPLHPYLEYAELRRRLGSAPADEVEAFIHRYRDSPLATRLQGTGYALWHGRAVGHFW
jgi:soluble lytic murein transglycosylase